MEKKIYERLELEILEFVEMDIICASGFEGDIDFGGGDEDSGIVMP